MKGEEIIEAGEKKNVTSNKRVRRVGKILTTFMELRSKKSWEKTALCNKNAIKKDQCTLALL